MRIVYVADDGTPFGDEWSCTNYEWRQNHPHIAEVLLYGKRNKRIKEDIFSEDVYNTVEKIVIETEEILKDFRALVDETGFCCYEDITEVGTWKFNDEKQTFVKVK